MGKENVFFLVLDGVILVFCKCMLVYYVFVLFFYDKLVGDKVLGGN